MYAYERLIEMIVLQRVKNTCLSFSDSLLTHGNGCAAEHEKHMFIIQRLKKMIVSLSVEDMFYQ